VRKGIWLCILLLLGGLIGCSTASEPSVQSAAEFNAREQSFLAEFQRSLHYSSQVIQQLDELLDEMQQHDELAEAIEYMEIALAQVSNEIDGLTSTQEASWQLMREQYVEILSKYQNGLSVELQGMKEGDGVKMKDGYQATQTSKQQLIKFTAEFNEFYK
jgi:hypothetical protein